MSTEMVKCFDGDVIEVCEVDDFLIDSQGFFFEISCQTICEGVFQSWQMVGHHLNGNTVQIERHLTSSISGQKHSLTLQVFIEDDVEAILMLKPSSECEIMITDVHIHPVLEVEKPVKSEPSLIRILKEYPEDSEEFQKALSQLQSFHSILRHLPSVAAIIMAAAIVFFALKL